jgi:hypothetical protein
MPITTTPGGGPQGEFSTNTPIYSTTLSATATSVILSNIPTTFTDLVLVVDGSFSSEDYLNLQFNGDTSTSYSDLPFRGNGSSASAGAASSRAFIWTNTQASANSRFMCRSNIQNYSNPNINKSVVSRADSTTGFVAVNVGTWRKTEPITSIRVYSLSGNNFNVGSTFTIYGIKAAAPAPKATGGDVVTTDGTYWYHAFKNSGVLDVKQNITVDYLVVAGGGAGGIGYYGGGGGAGGFSSLGKGGAGGGLGPDAAVDAFAEFYLGIPLPHALLQVRSRTGGEDSLPIYHAPHPRSPLGRHGRLRRGPRRRHRAPAAAVVRLVGRGSRAGVGALWCWGGKGSEDLFRT